MAWNNQDESRVNLAVYSRIMTMQRSHATYSSYPDMYSTVEFKVKKENSFHSAMHSWQVILHLGLWTLHKMCILGM